MVFVFDFDVLVETNEAGVAEKVPNLDVDFFEKRRRHLRTHTNIWFSAKRSDRYKSREKLESGNTNC